MVIDKCGWKEALDWLFWMRAWLVRHGWQMTAPDIDGGVADSQGYSADAEWGALLVCGNGEAGETFRCVITGAALDYRWYLQERTS